MTSFPVPLFCILNFSAPKQNFSLAVLSALLFAGAAGYLSFRYVTLRLALREINRDLTEILQDLTQNRILRLPLPNRDLERLTKSFNAALEEIRRERLSFEKRETQFQELIENISHDLRTPLTVILGYLKWMQKEDSPCRAALAECSQQARFLSIIEKNARAMEKLVAQFYAFSRLHAQDYALELQPVDICRILRESIADHYQFLESVRLAFSCCLPSHPVMIRGNGEALERIFSNLLHNAEKYAHSSLHVCLEETAGPKVRIVFRNDSVCLKETEIPHLFDRFYKCDNSRHNSGSGLGLTVAKSLTELMDGDLSAFFSHGTMSANGSSTAPGNAPGQGGGSPRPSANEHTEIDSSPAAPADEISFALVFPITEKDSDYF